MKPWQPWLWLSGWPAGTAPRTGSGGHTCTSVISAPAHRAYDSGACETNSSPAIHLRSREQLGSQQLTDRPSSGGDAVYWTKASFSAPAMEHIALALDRIGCITHKVVMSIAELPVVCSCTALQTWKPTSGLAIGLCSPCCVRACHDRLWHPPWHSIWRIFCFLTSSTINISCFNYAPRTTMCTVSSLVPSVHQIQNKLHKDMFGTLLDFR